MTRLLDTQGLTRSFGGLLALDELNLTINQYEIVALIGPNGAGKTTFFNCITGLIPPTSGQVLVTPPGRPTRRIDGLKPNQITRLGLARTFQNIRLFPKLTTLENVMIGRHARTRAGIIGAVLRDTHTRREEQETISLAYELLARFDLEDYADEIAANLPYGAQRRLEIVRALATQPFLLLLDEPAAGLNLSETRELERLIDRIRREIGLTVLLIEHNMDLVMSLSDRVYVLDYGRMIAMGPPTEIKANAWVIKSYLGEAF